MRHESKNTGGSFQSRLTVQDRRSEEARQEKGPLQIASLYPVPIGETF